MRKPTGFLLSSAKRFIHTTASILPTVTSLPMSGDSYIESYVTTSNYGSATTLKIGGFLEDVGGSLGLVTRKTWVKPDFSSIAAGKIFDSIGLNLVKISGETGTTIEVYRCLRDGVESEITWVRAKVITNWATAGCGNSTSDYDGSALLGSGTIPSSGIMTIPLDKVEMLKLYNGTYSNYGLILFATGGASSNGATFGSTNNATPSNRPTMLITHT